MSHFEDQKCRVRCGVHHYDTMHTLSRGTAISAARMHAQTGCTHVETFDRLGEKFDWRTWNSFQQAAAETDRKMRDDA